MIFHKASATIGDPRKERAPYADRHPGMLDARIAHERQTGSTWAPPRLGSSRHSSNGKRLPTPRSTFHPVITTKKKSARLPRSSETKLASGPTSLLRKVAGKTDGNISRKKVRMFPRRESKQPTPKAKENVEAFGAEGEEVRRRPRERVRCSSLGVSLVAPRRARARGRQGGDGGDAARYRRRVGGCSAHGGW